MVKYIAVIPARGGSKGIPKKNIKLFLGKPLIAHTIECALAADIFDRVIVSTDDEAIAAISEQHGASVPFLRPKKISGDNASAASVVLHLANELNLDELDVIFYLQPTSPLKKISHLQKCSELIKSGFESAVTVNSIDLHDDNIFVVENDKIKFLFSESQQWLPRQQRPQKFYINGACFAFQYLFFKENHAFYDQNSGYVEMSSACSIDIDDLDDWALAEYYGSFKD